MTRTRQVFDRDTVAHLWAHAAQDSARDAAHSFYFTGPTIYSYGSHFAIAHILSDECGPELAGRVLWNESAYSNTTSKHKNHAWRALTQQQREHSISVPSHEGMTQDSARSIERALREKTLPVGLVDSAMRAVSGSINALIGKRYQSGPWNELIRTARQSEEFARMFYTRAGRKYPLPLVDSRPTSSDKTEWSAWIKRMSGHLMRDDYAKQCKQARAYLEQAEANAAKCGAGFPYFPHNHGQEWEARNVVGGTYDVAQKAQRACDSAAQVYRALHGKALPAAMLKIAKRAGELAELFRARRDEFTRAENRSRVVYDVRRAITNARLVGKNAYIPARVWADMESLYTRATEAGVTDPLYLSLAQRMARIGAGHTAQSTVAHAADSLGVARDYLQGKCYADAMQRARETIRKCEFARRLDVAPSFAAWLAQRVEPLETEARAVHELAHAAVTAREAETLRAWLAGESNVRPSYEAGTYARINAKTHQVETTRGATVPIEHACRLSRLYAVAVRKGGGQWADGQGPMVGHYRVNYIGSDGAITIGCHEFDAAEGKRLHALLSACVDCVHVNETEGV